MSCAPFGIGSDTWPGLSKLMEEAGEVVQVCAKLIATGGNPDEHWSGEDLQERLVEEVGDLWAAIQYFNTHNHLPGVGLRRDQKYTLFQNWDSDENPT